jgi:isoamylase
MNGRVNFWGYSTINFFSPMTRYAAAGNKNCGREAIKEFKTLVREAHKLGMEVSPATFFIRIYQLNQFLYRF